MEHFIRQLGSLFSRLLNVMIGGYANTTLSARAYREDWEIRPQIDACFRAVLREKAHCQEAWEDRVRRAWETIAEDERLRRERS